MPIDREVTYNQYNKVDKRDTSVGYYDVVTAPIEWLNIPGLNNDKRDASYQVRGLDKVDGDLEVPGDLTIDGTLEVGVDANITGNVDISGNITVEGDNIVEGNTTLGDSTEDVTIINSRLVINGGVEQKVIEYTPTAGVFSLDGREGNFIKLTISSSGTHYVDGTYMKKGAYLFLVAQDYAGTVNLEFRNLYENGPGPTPYSRYNYITTYPFVLNQGVYIIDMAIWSSVHIQNVGIGTLIT